VQFLTLDASRQAMEDLLVAQPDVKGAFAFNQLVLQGAY
jgi:ABC-type sugar transport system substrate-binding protein